jgi:thiol:disulfide interchange protein DsbC
MNQIKTVVFSAILSVSLLTTSNISLAEQEPASEQDAIATIKKVVKKQLNLDVTSVKPTPLQDIYEVTVPPRVFYVSANGQYVLAGDLIDMKNGMNLSEVVREKARIASVENVGEENMVVFAPKKVKHTITVFTDIDCGYCRKLHNEMASYNKLGIKVRYLAYPRAGIGSPSYNKAVTVWCSNDKEKAMTEAKSGKELPPKNCKNPVASQMALGRALGVNGTPAIVLANGQIYPGYAPADKLVKVLEQVQAQASAK